ncbi:hypothetical protein [Microbacterium sp. Marseille-Q6965]|nr:hypothetical protein [Microbacterium sp. Marseille-Q6965]
MTKSKDRRIASLTFRDASNHRWVRTEGGLLESMQQADRAH